VVCEGVLEKLDCVGAHALDMLISIVIHVHNKFEQLCQLCLFVCVEEQDHIGWDWDDATDGDGGVLGGWEEGVFGMVGISDVQEGRCVPLDGVIKSLQGDDDDTGIVYLVEEFIGYGKNSTCARVGCGVGSKRWMVDSYAMENDGKVGLSINAKHGKGSRLVAYDHGVLGWVDCWFDKELLVDVLHSDGFSIKIWDGVAGASCDEGANKGARLGCLSRGRLEKRSREGQWFKWGGRVVLRCWGVGIVGIRVFEVCQGARHSGGDGGQWGHRYVRFLGEVEGELHGGGTMGYESREWRKSLKMD